MGLIANPPTPAGLASACQHRTTGHQGAAQWRAPEVEPGSGSSPEGGRGKGRHILPRFAIILRRQGTEVGRGPRRPPAPQGARFIPAIHHVVLVAVDSCSSQITNNAHTTQSIRNGHVGDKKSEVARLFGSSALEPNPRPRHSKEWPADLFRRWRGLATGTEPGFD